MSELEGTVIRAHGGHYYVRVGDRTLDCAMRGRLKRRRATSDLVAVGDRVRCSLEPDGGAIVEEVLPRKSVLSRNPPPARDPRPGAASRRPRQRPQMEQVLVANPDLVLIVFSLARPPLNPFMLDRYLVACEAVQLPAVIVGNKVDLLAADLEGATEGAPGGDAGVEDLGTAGEFDLDEYDRAEDLASNAMESAEILRMYEEIGYRVVPTSIVTGEGLEELRRLLHGKLSVLTGPSGVGKSSLMNGLWPELDLKVGEISEYHDRGKHTTVVAELYNPEPDTYVADTPGLRQFRFWDIDPEQLDAFYPEMKPYLTHCRFAPCTHTHEPGCAVSQAVERGEIPALRYESYLRMFEHGF
ncbi:MAG: ribosome small subunit-dependent GTPase A [Anaerolineae bacterium]